MKRPREPVDAGTRLRHRLFGEARLAPLRRHKPARHPVDRMSGFRVSDAWSEDEDGESGPFAAARRALEKVAARRHSMTTKTKRQSRRQPLEWRGQAPFPLGLSGGGRARSILPLLMRQERPDSLRCLPPSRQGSMPPLLPYTLVGSVLRPIYRHGDSQPRAQGARGCGSASR